MDPSFSRLCQVIHEERLQAAAKERHFRNVGIPEEETELITPRSIKWVALLVILTFSVYSFLLGFSFSDLKY
jgi:hypothetical protein